MVQGHDGEFSCDRILIRRYRYPAHWTGTRPDPVISRSYEFAEVSHHVQPLGGLVARPRQPPVISTTWINQNPVVPGIGVGDGHPVADLLSPEKSVVDTPVVRICRRYFRLP